MKITSQEASKLLKQYNEQLSYVQNTESKSNYFLAALGEDPESVRPKYDYEETQATIQSLSTTIRKIKHTINVFNTTTIIPGFDMTIDEMLVYIPQLTHQKDKLWNMMNRLPKVRETGRGYLKNPIIDYNDANYDIEKAKADYDIVVERLSAAQTALDLINSTQAMELVI